MQAVCVVVVGRIARLLVCGASRFVVVNQMAMAKWFVAKYIMLYIYV